jgi:drug/metabolite transporter (DMT)-like permease
LTASRLPALKKTLLVLIPAVLSQAAGNVLLSMSMKEIGTQAWWPTLVRAVEMPHLWVGFGLLALSFALFAAALSWADLTFVLPAISVEVVVNVLSAEIFLQEAITGLRWAGVILISTGVVLVLRSERRKNSREKESILAGNIP